MKNYRKTIDALRDETAKLEQSLQEEFAALGTHLRETYPDLCHEDTAQESCREYEEASERLSSTQESKARIATIQSRIEAIRQEISDGSSERKHLQQEASAVFPGIGRRAFEIFHDNTYLEADYAERFSEIAAAQNEVNRLQAELDEQEAILESKPFLDRIVTRGRVVLLKNRVSSRSEAMEKQYRRLGETIVDSEFIREVNDEELNRIAEPYFAAERRISDIADRAEQLDKERNELETELSQLCEGHRPGKASAEFDDKIQKLRDNQYNALAQFARKVSAVLSDEMRKTAGSYLERIASTESAISEKQATIQRLEAALEVERLQSEIEQVNNNIGLREREIEAAEKRKTELFERRAELEEQRAAQEDKRGSVDDL
jgi:chromosome segregation ATPase